MFPVGGRDLVIHRSRNREISVEYKGDVQFTEVSRLRLRCVSASQRVAADILPRQNIRDDCPQRTPR